jgi:hypothetical protein
VLDVGQLSAHAASDWQAIRGARNVWTGAIHAFKKHPVAIVGETLAVALGALSCRLQ